MTEHDSLPISTFYHRSHNVPQLKFYFCIGMGFTTKFYNIIMHPPALSGCRGQIQHSIAPINIQHGTHWSQAMGWI